MSRALRLAAQLSRSAFKLGELADASESDGAFVRLVDRANRAAGHAMRLECCDREPRGGYMGLD